MLLFATLLCAPSVFVTVVLAATRYRHLSRLDDAPPVFRAVCQSVAGPEGLSLYVRMLPFSRYCFGRFYIRVASGPLVLHGCCRRGDMYHLWLPDGAPVTATAIQCLRRNSRGVAGCEV